MSKVKAEGTTSHPIAPRYLYCAKVLTDPHANAIVAAYTLVVPAIVETLTREVPGIAERAEAGDVKGMTDALAIHLDKVLSAAKLYMAHSVMYGASRVWPERVLGGTRHHELGVSKWHRWIVVAGIAISAREVPTDSIDDAKMWAERLIALRGIYGVEHYRHQVFRPTGYVAEMQRIGRGEVDRGMHFNAEGAVPAVFAGLVARLGAEPQRVRATLAEIMEPGLAAKLCSELPAPDA